MHPSFTPRVASAGRVVHRGSGAVIPGSEYGVSEATKGLTKLELRELELKDMEVAKKLQEEEIKVRAHLKKQCNFTEKKHTVCLTPLLIKIP